MNRLNRLVSFSSLVLTLLVAPTSAHAQDTGKPPEFSPELQNCLKEKLGSAYAEISSGDREATDAEFELGDGCFEQFGPKQDPATQPKAEDLKFTPGTETCLKEKLGENFKAEFSGQKTKGQAKAFRAKTKDCFGKNVAGNGPQELPAEVKSCIVSAVGDAAASEMLQGKPPAEGSENFEKVKKAGCFKNFGPPGGGGPGGPELSADKKACVEKIMGHSFEDTRTEPTDEQKQQMGKDCFGGQGGPGGPNGGPQMPAEVQSCLETAFGDQLEDLKKGPEFLTDEQKSKADSCFKKNNFNPGGEHDGPSGGPNGGPQLSEEARTCVEGIMGGKLDGPREPTEEQKQRMGKECFGGQGGPGGPNGGPGGPGGEQRSPNDGPGANLPADKRECVERIMSSGGNEPTEEQKQQVGRECFGSNGGGPGAGPGERVGPEGSPPNGEARPNEPLPQKPLTSPSGPPPGPEGQPPQPPTGGSSSPPSADQQACIDRITGSQQPTAEQRAQIERECFAR